MLLLITVGVLVSCDSNKRPKEVQWSCHISSENAISGRLESLTPHRNYEFFVRLIDFGEFNNVARNKLGGLLLDLESKNFLDEVDLPKHSVSYETITGKIKGSDAPSDYIVTFNNKGPRAGIALMMVRDNSQFSTQHDLEEFQLSSLHLQRRNMEAVSYSVGD